MTPSQQIDLQIKSEPGWKGNILQKLRDLIHKAEHEIVEEWKWDTAVFARNGMVCAVSPFKEHVKINFFKGAQITDSSKLFNNGFESKNHRSVDFTEESKVNEEGIIDLVRQAVLLNSKKK